MKAPLSIRIIYWLSQITYWLVLVLSGAILIVNLVFMTNVFDGDIQLRIHMPVPIEVIEEGSLNLQGMDQKVKIEEATGKLYLIDTPIFITRTAARILMVVILITFYMTHCFREFITNIKNGLLFENSNIKYLKRIAYGLLGLWLSTIIYSQIVYYYLVKHLEFDTIIISQQLNKHDYFIQAALLLWALAHIFAKGNEMQQDQELTI